MRRHDLVVALTAVPPFPDPDAALEQVATPPESAAVLLEAALARGDLVDRSVADLGAGTGRLAVGAALLGARPPVQAWEVDPRAIAVGRAAALRAGAEVEWIERPVGPPGPSVETIVMNPPFGAQTAHADRPFWDAALGSGAGAIYAFALRDSRSFIERRRVAAGASLDDRRPVEWTLPATFRHHRKRAVSLEVDLWVLRRPIPP